MRIKQWVMLLAVAVACTGIDPQLPKHIIQIYGNATLGYYYANLYIGTPPQEQSVIIDTGSGQLAMPCSQCVSCGSSHIHQPFDLRQSSSSKIVTCNSGNELCKERCNQQSTDACTFLISYAEGSSLSGILIQDAIQFELNSKGQAITTTFGCTVRETNLFYTQAANGIFGLAPQRKTRLLDLLYQKHSKFTGEEFLFSICLAKSGGILAIGRVEKEMTKDIEPVRTSFNSDRNLYSLEGVGVIRIGNSVLREGESMGYYGLFIDSGSTFTYFRTKEYNMILQEIENSCALRADQCKIAKKSGLKCVKVDVAYGQTLRDALLDIFPSLSIEINGQVVKWMPDRYFLLRNRHTGEACLGIEALDRILLGANWMVDRNIVFNLKEKTVQIYSGVTCAPSNDKDGLPIYTEDTGSLSYMSAVLKIDEAVLTRVIFFIMLAVAFVAMLLFVGVYCFKRKPVAGKKSEGGEEEHATIAQAQQGLSQRGLEAQSSEEVHVEKGEQIPIEVENFE